MRTLTPSKITAWLTCNHYLTLRHKADAGEVKVTNGGLGSFSRLIADKGLEHEAACLEDFQSRGLRVLEVPARSDSETFEQWAERSRSLLAQGHDILYQLPLVHEGVRGIADFMVRVDKSSSLGAFSYEPVDAKLARAEAKPGHVLQLCFYAEALAAIQGRTPDEGHLWLGSGSCESIPLSSVLAYWRRLRTTLPMSADPTTLPSPCTHCAFCEFADHCDSIWRAEDALHYVAGLRTSEQDDLASAGVRTMRQLAESATEVDGIRPERLTLLRRQAALQRTATAHGQPPMELLGRNDSTDVFRASLPMPDDADLVLDFEGHPFLTPAAGLFFLFGYLEFDQLTDGWVYRAMWAHDKASERAATISLVDMISQRRANHPGMHVYHYNHTERSSLQQLADEHDLSRDQLNTLVAAGVFVDILDVVRNTVIVGAESYSLKVLERVAGYERSHDIDQGAGAVLAYERWRNLRQQDDLDRIAHYNEDDVRATLAVRNWLLAGPLAAVDARPTVFAEPDDGPAVDELVKRLQESDENWEQLLAHLLGYWARERRTYYTQRLALLDGTIDDHLRHAEIVGGCTFIAHEPAKGSQKHGGAILACPPQVIDDEILRRTVSLAFPLTDGGYREVSIRAIDVAAGRLTISWNSTSIPDGTSPTALVATNYVHPRAKQEELVAFARRVVDERTSLADEARIALLRRQSPQFESQSGLPEQIGPSLGELQVRAMSLTSSVLAVQGPPGTGKTYTGTQVAAQLIEAGKKVGITAFSHEAINNFLRGLIAHRPGVRILRGTSAPTRVEDRLPGTTYGGDAGKWHKGDFEVLASTTWLFAHGGMTGGDLLDVLFVDEAGQLGLADTLAAMGSARSTLLLGDPLQLAQVTQAVHPAGSGLSALEHVLGESRTMPGNLGAFLDVTYRMHPNITAFISEQIYDGRLRSHESCAIQSVDGAAGLRWLPVAHVGNSQSSVEEAETVRSIIRSHVGSSWTDSEGGERTLMPSDVMVVAPYNEHVALIRHIIDNDPETVGARIGTVDKFQGQEAPVVIFSMATSSGADMPRTADFLFSKNRLNVAVSRARALAYVVCTEELLGTRARDVEEMKLIATLCRFAEMAERVKDIDHD